MEDTGGGEATRACRLAPLLRAPDANGPVIESAVQRLHQTVLHATEAIALLLHEDVEAGVPPENMIRIGEHGAMDAAFRAVVSGRSGSRDSEHATLQSRVLAAFRRIHGDQKHLVDGRGLGQLIKYESKFWIATMKTSMRVHFRKRVLRACKLKLRLPDDEYDALDAEGRKAQTARVLRVTTDVCRPEWEPRVADEADAPIVDATRAVLGLDSMRWGEHDAASGSWKMHRTLGDLVKANPHHFVRGLVALNASFAAAGERTFRVVPMRTSLTPKFVHFDQVVVRELGLLDDATKRKLADDTRRRLSEQRSVVEERKALLLGHKQEKAAWSQESRARGRSNAKPKAPKKGQPASPEYEAWLAEKERERVEKEARKARVEAMEAEVAAFDARPDVAKIASDARREKDEAVGAVFSVDGVRGLTKKQRERWNGSIKTDAVSARIFVDKKGEAAGKDSEASRKRDRTGRRPLPRCGLLSVDELAARVVGAHSAADEADADAPRPLGPSDVDGLSPRDQNAILNKALEDACGGTVPFQTIGLDPGMRELAVLSDPDFEPARRPHELHPKQQPLRLRYTQPQRRDATRPARYFLKPKHANDPERRRRADAARAYRHEHVHTPQHVLDAERSLTGECAAGSTAAAVLSYCRARAAVLPTLLEFHAAPKRRQLRWKAFVEEQRSFSQFCDGIERMRQRGNDQKLPLVLAYGAWALSGARPAGKGLPPCVGKGLLRKLARRFLVVAVPEHFTSKRCFHCGGECGNHPYLADRDRRASCDERLEERRRERLERAETREQRVKAVQWYERALSRPCEIRGLRFCSGCKRCLNRDANSAPQMGVQLKRLVLGLHPLHRVPPEDEELQRMSLEIEA